MRDAREPLRHLRWLVAFADAPRPSTERALADARQHLEALNMASSSTGRPIGRPTIGAVHRWLVHDVLATCRRAVVDETPRDDYPGIVILPTAPAQLVLMRQFTGAGVAPICRVGVGRVRALVGIQHGIALLLRDVGHHLRWCPVDLDEGPCHRLFVRTRRQEACSARCAQRRRDARKKLAGYAPARQRAAIASRLYR